MKINIKTALICLTVMVGISSCNKQEYSFGQINTPANVQITAVIEQADADHPDGGGNGNVSITITSSKAISYKIDFGDGNTQIVPTGVVTHKYANPGTFDYTIIANAIGTGGATSIATKKITVFVAYTIPADIVQNLTNGSSQTWVTDREAPGHVGVGPTNTFTPDYYAAAPNERADCLYDDLITFTKNADGTISMTIDNKGQSFLIAASTTFYGLSGGDNCYGLDMSGTRKLAFMDATSASTPDISTRVQFIVPGNGLINFGTGGNTYEILSLSPTNVWLRNIGIDGLAWYQKLKVQ